MWFTNVVKPTHRCNLNCVYCYNEDTRHPVMPLNILERTIEQTFLYACSLDPLTSVDFIWHGGEPMSVGMDFYSKALAIQAKASLHMSYANSIQTNGTLLDNRWIDFFKVHNFDVSLSLDGPESLNDSTRRYSGGDGSFRHVMRGIRLLRDAAIPHGVCVVISQSNRHRTDEIFDFLVKQQLPFNIIPLTRSGAALTGYTDIGIGPDEYADPWIKLFDRWFDASGNDYVQCTDFVRKSRAILLGRPTDCIGQEQCASHHVSTDPDGYVYPCATLSGDPDWSYGNISEQDLIKLMATPQAISSRNRQIDEHCKSCKWQHVCHGGCMSRSIKYFGTHNTRDYYCPSLYRIYDHIEHKLRQRTGLDLSALPSPNHIDVRPVAEARPLTLRRIGFSRSSLTQIDKKPSDILFPSTLNT